MIALARGSVAQRSHRQRVVRLPVSAVLILVGCVLTAACTSFVPRQYLPYPLTNDTFDDSVKVVNIPLPVIKTDPNEGVSLGALSAFLLHNRNDEIGTMIVPQINYNQNFGLTMHLFGAFYPEPGRRWEFTLSKSTHVNEDYTLKFRDSTWLDRKLEVAGEVSAFTDGSARFFGFQSQSSSRDETNYADEEKGFNVSAAYRILPHIQLMIGERVRRVDIGRGAVTTLPGIQDRFSAAAVPGINGFTAHAQRAGVTFSTLDDPNLPTRGLYGTGVFEVTTKALGSSADYRHYTIELKGFFPLKDARYVTAVRTAYNQTLNRDVPFLEQSILGGKNTLRGHGDNRFVDSSYLLLNVEERIRLFRYRLFNVNTDWEIAPFIDIGEVAKNLLDVTTRNFVVNPGVGFRAVVRPNVVGRVDIGFGKEGAAVFATLGYPF